MRPPLFCVRLGLGLGLVLAGSAAAAGPAPGIKLNQIGYLPQASKLALVPAAPGAGAGAAVDVV